MPGAAPAAALRRIRLCLLGFGGAARRLCELLAEQAPGLAADHGLTFAITAVGTAHHGSWCDPNGLTPQDVLALTSAPDWSFPDPPRPGADLVTACGADVLVEATPLEPGGATAAGHVEAALRHGLHVVTLNKGPIAWHHGRLAALAERHDRALRYEGTVMDGCPVFSLVEQGMPGATVSGFSGVLNSTSNVVLDHLSAGGTVAEAVRDAQAGGYAEAVPQHDLSGLDTATKVAVLANVWLGAALRPEDVPRQGVDETVADRAVAARQAGHRLRLLGSASAHDDHVDASVDLVEVGPTSPFFATAGATGTLQVFTDLAGVVEVTERNPGLTQTAYAVLADLLQIHRRT